MLFSILILLVIVILMLIVSVDAGVLFWCLKLFKVGNPTYKYSLKILLTASLVAALSAGFLAILFQNKIGLYLIVFLATSLTSWKLIHSQYQITHKKTLAILFTFIILSIIPNFIIRIGTAAPIRSLVVEPFVVSGKSMNPTYETGDYLLVKKFGENYSRGDVVIYLYHDTKNEDMYFIHRIMGLPNENLEIKKGSVFINGEMIAEAYTIGITSPDSKIQLGADEYFLLGDNREASFDSRKTGPVKLADIQGEIDSKISFLSHK